MLIQSPKISFSNSFPIFENPYPMDIHESPVTYTDYFADCPPDLIPVLYSIGAKHKKQGYSNKVKRGKVGCILLKQNCIFIGTVFCIKPPDCTVCFTVQAFKNKTY